MLNCIEPHRPCLTMAIRGERVRNEYQRNSFEYYPKEKICVTRASRRGQHPAHRGLSSIRRSPPIGSLRTVSEGLTPMELDVVSPANLKKGLGRASIFGGKRQIGHHKAKRGQRPGQSSQAALQDSDVLGSGSGAYISLKPSSVSAKVPRGWTSL